MLQWWSNNNAYIIINVFVFMNELVSAYSRVGHLMVVGDLVVAAVAGQVVRIVDIVAGIGESAATQCRCKDNELQRKEENKNE